MPDAATLVLLVGVGLLAGAISGVVGFGSAVLLLPVCHAAFGPLPSVGILTVAALIGNLSRVGLWWRDVRWGVVWRFWLGGVPFALLGSLLLVSLNVAVLSVVFGAFVIALVPMRRGLEKTERRMKLGQFPVLGAAMGFLSAVVSTSGPINAPFFLSYGLTGGAYVSTEALCTAGIHLTKSLAYGRFAALDTSGIATGLGLGLCLLIGAAASKPWVLRLRKERFVVVVEAFLILAGGLMTAQGLAAMA